MNGHRRLAALFVMLTLGACAQVAGQGQAPYAPYSRGSRATVAVACSGQSVPEEGQRSERSRRRDARRRFLTTPWRSTDASLTRVRLAGEEGQAVAKRKVA
jgi:hypothetical protein